MYYLRTRAAADAIKFTVDKENLAASDGSFSASGTGSGYAQTREQKMADITCSLDNKDDCVPCGS